MLGPALRALVLCDFERLPARLPASLRETPIDEDSGSARLVFATLASADVGGVGALRPLLVTGQTFACAAELAAELVQRCQRAGHQVSAPVPKPAADVAFDNAQCIGCGACVAACPNGSAMLFTSAKVTHLNTLPQGAPERESRVLDMVSAMDDEGFGGCTNTGACTTACPKSVPLLSIANLNREFLRAARKAPHAARRSRDRSGRGMDPTRLSLVRLAALWLATSSR